MHALHADSCADGDKQSIGARNNVVSQQYFGQVSEQLWDGAGNGVALQFEVFEENAVREFQLNGCCESAKELTAGLMGEDNDLLAGLWRLVFQCFAEGSEHHVDGVDEDLFGIHPHHGSVAGLTAERPTITIFNMKQWWTAGQACNRKNIAVDRDDACACGVCRITGRCCR